MKNHAKLFWLTMLSSLILNLLVFSPSAFAQYFTINRYHADITIHPDSSFIVQETIDVTFHRPRHGIYREIPFKYRDELGKTLKTPTKVLSVKDASGRGWKYKVTRSGHLIHIRIGDPKRFVRDRQTYVIT